jgi:mannose-6-phosphate isomerase-like protein (cupin superfamily)
MPSETAATPFRVTAGEGLASVWFKTGRPTVKVSGAETGNAFAQIETDDPRGGAPPLHVHHKEDEAFHVLEGEVAFFAGDDRIDLSTGDCCFAPRDVPHTHVVRSEPARMLTTLCPAGLEELLVGLGVPVTDAERPTENVLPPMGELLRLFAGYGCEVLAPPPTLEDVS